MAIKYKATDPATVRQEDRPAQIQRVKEEYEQAKTAGTAAGAKTSAASGSPLNRDVRDAQVRQAWASRPATERFAPTTSATGPAKAVPRPTTVQRLNALSNRIGQREQQLTNMGLQLNQLETAYNAGDYSAVDKYNALANQYNTVFNQYVADVDSYNKLYRGEYRDQGIRNNYARSQYGQAVKEARQATRDQGSRQLYQQRQMEEKLRAPQLTTLGKENERVVERTPNRFERVIGAGLSGTASGFTTAAGLTLSNQFDEHDSRTLRRKGASVGEHSYKRISGEEPREAGYTYAVSPAYQQRMARAKLTADGLIDTGRRLNNRSTLQTDIAKEGLGETGQMLVDLGVMAVQMAADIGIAAATGGSMLVPMGIRSYGNGYLTAEQMGFTGDKAQSYALGVAAVEVLSEKMFSVFGIVNKFAKGAITQEMSERVIDGLVKRMASSAGGRTALNRLFTILFSAGSEGLEEVIAGVAEPFIRKLTLDSDVKAWKEIDWQEALYEGLLGGILGGLGGAVDLKNTRPTYWKYYRQGIDESIGRYEAAVKKYGLESKEALQAAKEVWDGGTRKMQEVAGQDPEGRPVTYHQLAALEEARAYGRQNGAQGPSLADSLNPESLGRYLDQQEANRRQEVEARRLEEERKQAEQQREEVTRLDTARSAQARDVDATRERPAEEAEGETVRLHTARSAQAQDVDAYGVKSGEFEAQPQTARGGVDLSSIPEDQLTQEERDELQYGSGAVEYLGEHTGLAQRLGQPLARTGQGGEFPALRETSQGRSEQPSRAVADNENAADEGGGAQFSIETTDDGKRYVQADRQVMTGEDPLQWGRQIETYINEKIRQGEDVMFPTEDGHLLVLTDRSAWKLTDRHKSRISKVARKMLSDEAYGLKLRAASQIDELIQVGRFGDYQEDRNASHYNDIGESGFNYFEAYFRDFDGKYYRVRFSAALNEKQETVYSIGDIQERRPPRDGSSGVMSGALNGDQSSSGDIIYSSGEESQEKTAMEAAFEQAKAKQGGTDNGAVYDGSSQRDAGERGRGGYGSLGGTAAGSEGGQVSAQRSNNGGADQAHGAVQKVADSADHSTKVALRLSNAAGLEMTSGQAKGIDRTDDRALMAELTDDMTAADEELTRIKGFLENRGYEVHFFKGWIGTDRGTVARGAHDNGVLWIKVDDAKWTATQIALHEYMHGRIWRSDRRLFSRLFAKLSEPRYAGRLNEISDRYQEALLLIKGSEEDRAFQMLEEMMCDLYAGMNEFAAESDDAKTLRSDVWADVESFDAEGEQETRGPPEDGTSFSEVEDEGKANVSSKYDYSKPFAAQVDDYKTGKFPKKDNLLIGATPDVFIKTGFNALPMTINQQHIDYALKGKPGDKNKDHKIGEERLKQLPEAIKSPVAIIVSETANSTSVVALLPFKHDGKTIITPVYIDGQGRHNNIIIDTNAVTSVYSRENAISRLMVHALMEEQSGRVGVYYLDTNKAADLLKEARVTLPKSLSKSNGFIHSIREPGSPVKPDLNDVTESQQFKRWFGNSKVVDEDGRPLVVYHGTDADFTVFDPTKGRSTMDIQGMFFSPWEIDAGGYGGKVGDYYLSIKNPAPEAVAYKALNRFKGQNDAGAKARDYLISLGYDGVNNNNEEYIAFYPEQIKSATDNIGTFALNNPDVRFSEIDEDEARRQDAEQQQDLQAILQQLNEQAARLTDRLDGKTGEGAEAAENEAEVRSEEDGVRFSEADPELERARQQAEYWKQLALKNSGVKDVDKLTRDLMRGYGSRASRSEMSGRMRQMEAFLRSGGSEAEARATARQMAEDMLNKAALPEDAADSEYHAAFRRYFRTNSISVPEEVKRGWPDGWGRFRKRYFGRINLKNDGMDVTKIYREASQQWPDLLPSDEVVMRAQDQLETIAEVLDNLEPNLVNPYGSGPEFDAAVDSLAEDIISSLTRTEEAKAKEDTRLQRTEAETEELRQELGIEPETSEEMTAAELMAARKKAEGAKRYLQKTQRRMNLTQQESELVDALIRGTLTEDQLPPGIDRQGVLAVCRAKQTYLDAMAPVDEYNRQRRERNFTLAEQLIENSDEWKDMKNGFAYARETARRIFYGLTKNTEEAQALIDTYVETIRKNEAAKNRMINEYNERIKKLGIDTKTKAGNKVSEAYAVQFVGEAEFMLGWLEQLPEGTTRDGLTYGEVKMLLDEFWRDNPNLDQDRVHAAVAEFRGIYDELFAMVNEARVLNGYAPIDYRKGYFPHFTSDQGDNIIQSLARGMGIGVEVTELPTSIAGTTHLFRPGIQWSGHMLRRTGSTTDYNVLEGWDRYIPAVANIIYHTEDIQKLRALETVIRRKYSDTTVQNDIDATRRSKDMTAEEINAKLDELFKRDTTQLNYFVQWLREYTNQLAGKKAELDRNVEKFVGRKVYRIVQKLENRVAANMLGGNISSAMTNFVPLFQAWGNVSTASMMRAMWDTGVGAIRGNAWRDGSSFLVNRKGYDNMYQTLYGKVKNALFAPFNWVDDFVSETVVRARYYDELRRGLSPEAAMVEADAFAGGVMADRAIGELPTIFNSKNPLVKVFTMFQVEVNNDLSHLLKDVPKDARKKGLAAVFASVLKYMLGVYMFNDLFEWLFGRRVSIDPLSMLNDLAGDATGYELPNMFESAVLIAKGEWQGWEEFENGKGGDFFSDLVGDLKEWLDDVPFISGLLGGGRFPIQAMLPEEGAVKAGYAALRDILKPEKDQENPDAYDWNKIYKTVKNPLYYWAMPAFGGQMRKIAEGIYAYTQHGSYSQTKQGRVLQYPILDYGDLVKAMVFGKTTTRYGKEWIESDFDSLTAPQTEAYIDLVSGGSDPELIYQILHDLKGTERTAAEKAYALASANLDDGERIALFSALDRDEEAQNFADLMGAGLTFRQCADVLDEYRRLKDLEDQTAKGDEGTSERRRLSTEFSIFLGDQGFDDKTVDAVQEIYDMQVKPIRYDWLTAAGIHREGAMELALDWSELEPPPGKNSATWLQKVGAVADAGYLSEGEKHLAVKALQSSDKDSAGQSRQDKYQQYIIDYGTPAEVYYDYTRYTDGLTGDDLDGDGKNDAFTKIDKKLAIINRLPLQPGQKTALAIFDRENVSEKTIYNRAPWLR